MDLRSSASASASSAPSLLLVLLLVLFISANGSSTKLYIVYMGEKQHDDPAVVISSHHDLLSDLLGSNDEALKSIVYSYKHGFSGFAAMLTESQAETLASLPQVISVKPNINHKMHTTRSWDFLGLDYYQPPQEHGLLQRANYGQNVIVGVIDSGIWPESRSFEDNGYGPVPARWKGVCQTGVKFNLTNCNRKVIGARWYAKGVDAEILKQDFMSPRDRMGHGTHVASTIAGSQVWNASYNSLGAGVARGGAPRSRLAIYKACWPGTCPEAGVLAAIDDAIHDGVDVLSLSLGGPGHEYLGSLHAVQRGISVVFAALNNGPAPQTVGNAAPWVITVAATTIDRSFPTLISLGNKEKLVGQSLNSLHSGDFKDLVLLSDQTANVSGKMGLFYSPVPVPDQQKMFADVLNVTAQAGLKGLIFTQYTDNLLDKLAECEGIMTCVLVDVEIGRRIQLYIAINGSKPLIKVSPAMSVVGNGVLSPRVAAFSSRGPSPTFPNALKPDVAAPGVSILAAEGDSYVLKSGTSMACPHVSAVVALLKSVHPDWSPAMIKSAIVTTASVTDRFGMPIQADGLPRKLADPFDFGGGHMNPDRAADPGLVYDVDARDYSRFSHCSVKPWDGACNQLLDLNLPSIAVADLKADGYVTVERTVTNVGPSESVYHAAVEAPAGVVVSVEPSVMTFTGGRRSAAFKVTFKAKQRVQGGYTFGSLTWADIDHVHSVRIPIAVRTVIQELVADVA